LRIPPLSMAKALLMPLRPKATPTSVVAAILEMKRFITALLNHSCGVDVEKPVPVPFRRTSGYELPENPLLLEGYGPCSLLN
jgi:hypothetical protein